MTEEQLQEHGYPRINPEASGRAIIYNLPEKKITPDRERTHNRTHVTQTFYINTMFLAEGFYKLSCSVQQDMLSLRCGVQGQRQRQLCTERGM